MSIFIIGAILVCLSFFLTWSLRQYALRHEIMDVPNARSSHIIPTPRGGGLGLVITFVLASAWLCFQGSLAGVNLAVIVIGGGAVALIGFWDDHQHVSRKLRISIHLLAATITIFSLEGIPAIPLLNINLQLGYLGYLLGIIGLVWLLNLYNFMDGIDGIAAIEAVTVALAAAIILWSGGNTSDALWFIYLALAVSGFLIWNWPPAKIFMGDVGSGFLGFVFGTMTIISSQSTAINLWAWGILLAVFIVDAMVTLMRRIIRGDKCYEAHRTHAYQRASRRWQSHLKVTVVVGLINSIWLFPLAWFAAVWPEFGIFLAVIAYMPLILLAWYLGAGKPE